MTPQPDNSTKDAPTATVANLPSGTVAVTRHGTGPLLVALHRSIGGDSLDQVVSALAAHYSVYAVSMPGFDDSERPDWARSPRDLAIVLGGLLADIPEERPVLVGFGLGGWVAAEMAVACPERLRALVLVSPLGVQPEEGAITDPFLVSTEQYVELCFVRPDAHHATFDQSFDLGTEAWVRRERNREMTTRIAWKPRMFDQTLPFRLPYARVPTMIVWGEEDRVLPRAAVTRFTHAMTAAELVVVAGCGHMLECEIPHELAEAVSRFVDHYA
ncbi:MAG: alpha/beta fold hydrolase [Acidimicrobiia bacterium]